MSRTRSHQGVGRDSRITLTQRRSPAWLSFCPQPAEEGEGRQAGSLPWCPRTESPVVPGAWPEYSGEQLARRRRRRGIPILAARHLLDISREGGACVHLVCGQHAQGSDSCSSTSWPHVYLGDQRADFHSLVFFCFAYF